VSARAVSRGVELRGVVRRFGEQTVLDGLDLTLEAGTATALMGPNASGKTTVGRLVLGLDSPDGGVVEGVAGARRTAVFQEDRLCAHLSATENLRLVLDKAEWPRVEAELRAVGLRGAARDKPVRDLSGGQRRRVAIARALVAEGEIVVLDEPLTGVDAASKKTLLAYIADRIAGRTTLLITHDRAEARALGARVVRLRGA